MISLHADSWEGSEGGGKREEEADERRRGQEGEAQEGGTGIKRGKKGGMMQRPHEAAAASRNSPDIVLHAISVSASKLSRQDRNAENTGRPEWQQWAATQT